MVVDLLMGITMRLKPPQVGVFDSPPPTMLRVSCSSISYLLAELHPQVIKYKSLYNEDFFWHLCVCLKMGGDLQIRIKLWENDDYSLDFGSTPIFRHPNSLGKSPTSNKGYNQQ